MVDLGDGVLGPASGAEAVAARLKVRLEDWLEHSLEGGLHHPVPHGRDAHRRRVPVDRGVQWTDVDQSWSIRSRWVCRTASLVAARTPDEPPGHCLLKPSIHV